jgi:hypothetical protein
MLSEKESDNRVFLGVLECPLRKGFVEFEFTRGDRVLDLKRKVEEVWGAPRTDIRQELLRHGHFMEAGAWALFCQTRDGAYVRLEEEDEIPCEPIASDAEAEENFLDRVAAEVGLDWRGLIHVMNLYERRRLNLVFKYEEPADKDYAIRLVALAAITGG